MQFQYGISKNTNIPFMPNTIIEQNVNTQLLLYYLDFYYRFSELDKDERPSPEIIRNHFLCDEWVRVYLLKLEQKKHESKFSNPSSSGKKTESSVYDF